MISTRAKVPTSNGDRYLQQLCKHWSHKLEVVAAPGHADITMFSGAVTALTAGSDSLDIAIKAETPEQLEETKEVVVRHLDRFAFREAPLTFDWIDEQAA